jgi:hypothetical protein
MLPNPDLPEPPVEQAHVTQVEVVNADLVVVIFSNGDSIVLESAKLRQFALDFGIDFSKGSTDKRLPSRSSRSEAG